MKDESINKQAISCMSGGYKSVFTQGVLTAFESRDFFANTYAGCSSSAIITSLAACGKVQLLDLSLWTEGLKISSIEGNSQSNAILHSLDKLYPVVENQLWGETSARLVIATSYVNNPEATLLTQTDKAKRFGQKLLIDAMKHNSDWKDKNLELHLYDTIPIAQSKLLTSENFKDVVYASTRMLHAWHIPAFINGDAYIDGSYTCLCPVVQLLEIGAFESVICILTEHEKRKVDIFRDEDIPDKVGDTNIYFVHPDMNLKDIGVDYYSASEDGLKQAFSHGVEKGLEFVDNIKKSTLWN